jgi:hypothetical protein
MIKIRILFIFLCSFSVIGLSAQTLKNAMGNGSGGSPQKPGASVSLDSLRKREESRNDSVVFTAKYIRFTNLRMLNDSLRADQLDTSLVNFQHYSPTDKPDKPAIHLGGAGLAARELLFEPNKTIGFQTGFHSLDRFMLRSDSVRYYIARAPYTELYYVSGTDVEQTFRVTHTQNIKPNWNVGFNYNRIGGTGLYKNQDVSHLNAAIFTWYRGPKNHYQVLAHALFNNIKAGENGSPERENIFDTPAAFSREAEFVRLSAEGANRPQQIWRENTLFVKQIYDLGKKDSLKAGGLPTQRFAYSFSYSKNRVKFFRNEPDLLNVFPHIQPETITTTNDSTALQHLSQEFSYSFYLRGSAARFLRNELRLTLAAQHDSYTYTQMGAEQKNQNVTLKGGLGYRFNERLLLSGQLNQIIQGSQAGDYLYDAQLAILLSKKVGKITVSAYLQNKSPEQLYNQVNYQYHQWSNNFKRTGTTNLAFRYENTPLRFVAQAALYSLSDYLYYRETATPRLIEPVQNSAAIPLLKLSVGKQITLGKFNLEQLVVYQKTTSEAILQTPAWYSNTSFYYNCRIFKVLHANIGFDVKYHTVFDNPGYAPNVSQFYQLNTPNQYKTYPVVDLFIRANLRRANLFLKMDHMSQGWSADGYYTVQNYPMQDRMMKFGVSWKFYN